MKYNKAIIVSALLLTAGNASANSRLLHGLSASGSTVTSFPTARSYNSGGASTSGYGENTDFAYAEAGEVIYVNSSLMGHYGAQYIPPNSTTWQNVNCAPDTGEPQSSLQEASGPEGYFNGGTNGYDGCYITATVDGIYTFRYGVQVTSTDPAWGYLNSTFWSYTDQRTDYQYAFAWGVDVFTGPINSGGTYIAGRTFKDEIKTHNPGYTQYTNTRPFTYLTSNGDRLNFRINQMRGINAEESVQVYDPNISNVPTSENGSWVFYETPATDLPEYTTYAGAGGKFLAPNPTALTITVISFEETQITLNLNVNNPTRIRDLYVRNNDDHTEIFATLTNQILARGDNTVTIPWTMSDASENIIIDAYTDYRGYMRLDYWDVEVNSAPDSASVVTPGYANSNPDWWWDHSQVFTAADNYQPNLLTSTGDLIGEGTGWGCFQNNPTPDCVGAGTQIPGDNAHIILNTEFPDYTSVTGVTDNYVGGFVTRAVESDVAIYKNVIDPSGDIMLNDIVTYQISVINNGRDPACNVVVTDNAGRGLNYVPGSMTGAGADDNGTWNYPSCIASGDQVDFTIQYRVITANADIDNVAVVTATGDKNPDDNSSQATVSAIWTGAVEGIPSMGIFGMLLMAVGFAGFALRRKQASK